METFWIVLVVVFLVVAGNALILLRTAKKPKLPKSVKPKPYDEDQDGW
jgi:hypothetical protein